MASTFDQVVHFGTDISTFAICMIRSVSQLTCPPVGVERFLRLIQSVAHILGASPALLAFLVPFVVSPASPLVQTGESEKSSSPPSDTLTTTIAQQALSLRTKINLVRRTLRLFRFLDSFRLAGLRLAEAPSFVATADAAAYSLLGVYGLLETVTLPDAYGVGLLGVESADALNREAARCWFAALAFSVVSGLLRLWTVIPAKKEGKLAVGQDKVGNVEKSSAAAQVKVKTASGHDMTGIIRKLLADGMDMLLPASGLGWLPGVEQWIVGAVMLVTTLITGWDVWHRCGRDVEARAFK